MWLLMPVRLKLVNGVLESVTATKIVPESEV